VASKHGKLGMRYGKALLKALLADQANNERLFQALDGIEALRLSVGSNREALEAIQNPMLDSERKKSLITEIMKHVTEDTMVKNFVMVMFENGRFQALNEVAQSFRQMLYAHARVVSVRVTSARELGQEEREFIGNSLRSRLPGTPDFLWQVDAEIIGGVLVEYEGHRIDASVKGRLASVERELLS
jgi:F-type H+-transporting ATPase subunit delta